MCELDLIFNFETLHAVLAEMIVGGVVIETGLEKVVSGVREGGGVKKRPVGGGGGGGGGGGSGGGGGGMGSGAFAVRGGWGRLR